MSTNESTNYFEQLFCPSLQDTCKLYLLATIDEYPVDVLAKLPLHMRRKLFMAMPVIDRVHFVGTVFLDGLEVVEYKDFNPTSNTAVYLSSTKFEGNVYPHIKADLVSALFGQFKEDEILTNYCTLSLHDAFDSFDCLDTTGYSPPANPLPLNNTLPTDLVVRFVNLIVHSLHFNNRLNIVYRSVGYCDLSHLEYCSNYDYDKDLHNSIIIPSRPFIHRPAQATYLCADDQCFYQSLELQNYRFFAEYCNLASSIPTHLKINPPNFLRSPIWRDYSTIRNNVKQPRAEGTSGFTADAESFISKPIYPYLQKLLRSVEYLTLNGGWIQIGAQFADYKFDSYVVVPYILMSAITANKDAACLKSVSIFGITKGAACVLSVSAIAGFLIGSDYFASSSSYYVEYGDHFCYNLSPPGDMYFIKSLTLDPFNGNSVTESMSITDSESISKVLKAVIDKQIDSIKNISVSGIKISPEEKHLSLEEFFESYLDPQHGKPSSDVEYVSQLLTSSLVKFIKKPQFHSLAVSELPESCCYRLVKTFLTTPASHDQTLCLLVRKAGSAMHSIDHLSSSPRHGAAFKTMNFNERSDNCKLFRLVANLPELCLKSIQLQAEALICISEEVKIDIPHVCISFRNLLEFPQNYVIPLRCGVSRYLCGNISLATLEFISGFSSDYSMFLSTINSIFKSLLSKQHNQRHKTLEEIRIQCPDPQYSRDSPDLNIDGLESPNDFHFDETSESYSSHASKRHNFYSTGSNLTDFFSLVQELGRVSVRLPTKLFNDTNNKELRRMVPDLEKRFGEKKIPKITINREYSSWFENTLQMLELITDEVVIIK